MRRQFIRFRRRGERKRKKSFRPIFAMAASVNGCQLLPLVGVAIGRHWFFVRASKSYLFVGFVIYAIIAGLILSAESSLAVTNGDIYGRNTAPGITEVVCEVTDIKGDTLEVKDTIGETYEFKTNDKRTFEEFKVGDNIYVELKGGRAVLIHT